MKPIFRVIYGWCSRIFSHDSQGYYARFYGAVHKPLVVLEALLFVGLIVYPVNQIDAGCNQQQCGQ